MSYHIIFTTLYISLNIYSHPKGERIKTLRTSHTFLNLNYVGSDSDQMVNELILNSRPQPSDIVFTYEGKKNCYHQNETFTSTSQFNIRKKK